MHNLLFVFILFSTMTSCSQSRNNNSPILISSTGQNIFSFTSQNNLIRYDGEKDEVATRQISEDVKFPVFLYTDEWSTNKKIVLFYNGGVDYLMVTQDSIQKLENNYFSHISEAIQFNDNVVVNSINGLFICHPDSLRVIKRIYCINNDSVCDIKLSVYNNKFLLISEIDNIQQKTFVRILDINLNQISKFDIDGIVKSNVFAFDDQLNRFLFIKDNFGETYLVDRLNEVENLNILHGYQSGTSIYKNGKFIYSDGSYLRCINSNTKAEEWKMGFTSIENVIFSSDHICIQTPTDVNVINYQGTMIYSNKHVRPVLKPMLIADHLVFFDQRQGFQKIKLK